MDAVLLNQMAARGYTPAGPVVEVAAAGGPLYVQRGASGAGQYLFIAHNGRFIGTDWEDPSESVSDPVAAGFNQFSATYRAGGETGTVTFSWNGARLAPLSIAPGHCQQPGGRC